MSINWVMLAVFVFCAIAWYCVFKIGFFHTIFWVMLGAMIGVLVIKFKERKNDYTRHIG